MRSSSQPRAHDFCRQLTANNTHTHTHLLPYSLPKTESIPLQKLHVSWGALPKKKKKVLQFTVSLYILGSHQPLARLVEPPPVSHRNNKKEKKKEEVKNPSPPSVIFTSSSWKQHGTTILFRRTLPSIRRRSIEDRRSLLPKKKGKRNPIAV